MKLQAVALDLQNQWLWSKESQERSSCSVFSAGNHSLHSLQWRCFQPDTIKLAGNKHYSFLTSVFWFPATDPWLWPQTQRLLWGSMNQSLPKSAGRRDRERYCNIGNILEFPQIKKGSETLLMPIPPVYSLGKEGVHTVHHTRCWDWKTGKVTSGPKLMIS